MLAFVLSYAATHRVQLAKFIAVGLTTLAIYVSCFHVFYRSVGVDYRIAVSLAYVITVGAHFLMNRFFTFEAAHQALAHHTWKYLLMLGLNYLVSLGVVWVTVELVRISPYFGLVGSTAITAGISFFMMKYFVFHHKVAA